MMDGQPTNSHQRLDQARAELRTLLAQVQAAGGAVVPKLRASVEQLQADITAEKATLRAAGRAVADAPEDTLALPEALVTLVNQASNQGAQGLFLGPVMVNAGLTPSDRDNRRRMLKQVRAFWITGVLDQSLYREVLITLELHSDPQAIGFMGPRLAARRAQEAQPLPSGTTIVQVYQAANQRLLILGAPGGGKTTLLLELARYLLDAAEHDETRPMPVLFNLSSWAQQRRPLEQWLIQELRDQYGVARRIARQWLADNRVLPLLDGLDEVAEPQRAACVAAINRFLQEHGGEGLVVCSRSADYQALGQHLLLDQAVQLQPLDDTQLDAYLAWAGAPLAGVRAVLEEDAELRELARAPLLLNVLILAYEGQRPEALLGLQAAVQRRLLFDRYIQRMFDRPARNDPRRYTREQTLRWLRWLARRMEQNDQTVFLIELMQPWWLHRWWQHGLYVLCAASTAVVGAVALGTSIGLLVGLMTGVGLEGLIGRFPTILAPYLQIAQASGTTLGLAGAVDAGLSGGRLFGLVVAFGGAVAVSLFQRPPARRRFWHRGVGIAVAAGLGALPGLLTFDHWAPFVVFWAFWAVPLGLVTGVLIQRGMIRPTEALRWDWRNLRRHWPVWLGFGLLIGLPLGLVFGLLSGLALGLISSLVFGVVSGLSGALFFGLPGWLIGGISQVELSQSHQPNAGMWRSLRHAIGVWVLSSVGVGLVVGLGLGLVMALVVALVKGGTFAIAIGLCLTLILGLVVGLAVAPVMSLYFGGLAVVQHVALRFVGTVCGEMPWNYPAFLDYAVERLLLRRVGGSYIFIHRMLLEHFAEGENEST